MKIVYCLNSIQHLGGIASVTVTKANALVQRRHEVFIAVSDFDSNKSTGLDQGVSLIDLGINYYEDDWKSPFHILKGILIKRIKHKKKLSSFLMEIKPDIVISVGQSEKYFLPKIKGTWKTVREFHYDKLYRIRRANSFLKKTLARIINFYDYNIKIKSYSKIVVLTQEDRISNWSGRPVISIPNPLTIKVKKISEQCNKKIIAVGRLEDQKNFQALIRVYRHVAPIHPDWTLEIWGEGSLKNELNSLVNSYNLNEYVKLKGKAYNISEVYSKADILAMTSLYEGWGLVLTEAMAHGVPVVSYDTPCGPKDIIIDGVSGFLIPMNDEKQMANKLNFLIEEKDLRKQLGINALQYSSNFSIEKIITQWEKMFEKLSINK